MKFDKKLLPKDKMRGSFLGPSFKSKDIQNRLKKVNAVYTELKLKDIIIKNISDSLIEGKIIGIFNGRMEFGQDH